jgi:hypothetical protein
MICSGAAAPPARLRLKTERSRGVAESNPVGRYIKQGKSKEQNLNRKKIK